MGDSEGKEEEEKDVIFERKGREEKQRKGKKGMLEYNRIERH